MNPQSRAFLFTTFDGGGNVAPIMSVVAALVARGHRVRVMSDEANGDEVQTTGARFVSWSGAPNKPRRAREFDPPDWTMSTRDGLRMMAEHFMGGTALAYARDCAAELDREAADLVVNFDMVAGVAVACEARAQKLALLATCISTFPVPGVPPFSAGLAPPRNESERQQQQQIASELERVFDAGLPALNAARAALGLPALPHFVDQMNAATMRFLGTARAFDFAPETLPPWLRYVGPLLRDPVWAAPWKSPWKPDDPRPLVVVGFSTSFQNHADCLQRVIDTCAALPVRVLVTLGCTIRQDEVRAAANTVIVDSAPHAQVMRQAAIVVAHGGHGTVMTALSHGVPLLVLPHGRDQEDNAVRIVERGAGLMLPNTANVETMRQALRRLLEEPGFRASAGSLGESIRAEIRDSTLIADLEALAGVDAAPVGDTDQGRLSRRDALRQIGAGAIVALAAARPSPAEATPVGGATLQTLRMQIRGGVIARNEPSFEGIRRSMIWNPLLPARSPELIVRATSVDDVARAVAFARTQGLRVAVRGSGHNYHAAPLQQHGLMLDVGGLNSIQVDAEARRASVGPGVKGGELIDRLAPLGLSFPVGHCADVGLSGYLLGGGIGWNAGAWGPACMSVRGVELVKADGEVVYADASHHPDLYWAARGAGRGFFAAVTRYDLQLYPMPPAIRSLLMNFDFDSAPFVAEWLDRIVHTVHPSVEVIFTLNAATAGGAPSATVAAFAMAESPASASACFGSLRQPPPGAKLLGSAQEQPTTLRELLMTDVGFPSGKRMTGDTRYSNATLRELTGALQPAVRNGAQAPSFVMCVAFGARSVPPFHQDAAFSMMGQVLFGAYAFWDAPGQDAIHRNWVRGAVQAIEPRAIGSYINEVDLAANRAIAQRCFSPAAWQRLTQLKRRYDGDNLFAGYESASTAA